MEVTNILWRNIKWRYQNAFTIVITILQPMIWLLLYSTVAGQTMKGTGIGNYTAFILPGLMVLVSFGACSSSGIMNYLLKANGSFYRILIAPVRRESIVLGQMLEAVVCTSIEVMIMYLVAVLLGVRPASGPVGILLTALIIFVTAFVISGITFTISLCLPNEIIYETVMNAIVLPLFFLSTALFPAESLSGGLKAAVNLNPFTHVINTLRRLLLEQNIDYSGVLLLSGGLLLLAAASFGLAVWKLKQEIEE